MKNPLPAPIRFTLRCVALLPAFLLCCHLNAATPAESATPAPLLSLTPDLGKRPDGTPLQVGSKAEGFKVMPVIGEREGIREITGPGVWETTPISGVVTLKFKFLGFESSQQQDMLTLLADNGRGFGAIRNVNSSGRINNIPVIAGKNGRYNPGQWHEVEVVLNTESGTLQARCAGRPEVTQKTGLTDAKFTGVSISRMATLRDFSVRVDPPPTRSPDEIRATEALAELEPKIRALPGESPEDLRKRTVLLYHLEKLGKAIKQHAYDVAVDIADDIRDGLGREMGRKEGNHPWLQPVLQETNNPFLDPVMNQKWYETFTATPDYEWNLATKETAAHDALYGKHGSFNQAVIAGDWLMDYAHPQSPLVDKPELLTRAMRRTDAYMDDCYYGRKQYHFFALGAAIMNALIIDKTYPNLLLPRQKARWTKAITEAGEYYGKGGDGGNYSNLDLGWGRIRLASGLFLGKQDYVDGGMKQSLTWDGNIFEDGGTSYIAKQNESPGYHRPCIDLAYDSYVMTRDPRILAMLAKLEYYPISINDSNHTTEWYTPPSWKQSWYGAGAFGGSRIVYYLTGNQYYKVLAGQDYLLKPTEPSMKDALVYRDHPHADKKLPNNYTLYDRNIQGVRMNYGLYSAAMNGRITDQLAGKNTLAGLTLAEPPRDGQVAFSAAVYGILAYPKDAPTISKESISVSLGRNFASLGADYTLAQRLAGPTRREVPWKGRQVWLYLPDRMIGLVELTPDGTQQSKAITLNIELGRGKKGAFDNSPAEKTGDLSCKFGNLLVNVLDTNLKGIRLSPKADGMAADGNRGPHNEFHLVDEPNLADWSAEARPYQGTYHAVVELKPATAQGEAVVRKIQQQDGVVGLSVDLNGTKYTALYNSGISPVSVETAAYTKAGKSSLFRDRSSFTATENLPVSVSSSVSIPSKQVVIIVSGNDPALHKPGLIGWKNFLGYFEKNTSEFEKAP